MKICTFLGHQRIYDKDISESIRIEVSEIIDKHNAVEFIFNNYNDFDKVCRNVVNEIKNIYIDKKIILTVMSEHPKKKNEDGYKFNDYTINDFDRFISPLRREKRKYFSFRYHQFCWAVEKSDFLICYVYEVMDKDLSKCMTVANKSKAKIIDLTNKETHYLVENQKEKLSDKDKLILEKREQGVTLKQVGLELNLTQERVRQLEVRAYRRIRDMLFNATNK